METTFHVSNGQTIQKGKTTQDALYQEAVAAYGRAMDRLVRAYEADPDKRRDLLQDILPFCILLAAWGVSFIVLRRRRKRWIRRELERLDLLEKDHR